MVRPAHCIFPGIHNVSHDTVAHSQVGILEYWNLSMELFNARIRSPVRDWKVSLLYHTE